MTQKTAIIVGGGIGGLATAALLAKSGMKVQLFEAREGVGGRAYLWEQEASSSTWAQVGISCPMPSTSFSS
jgi:phytoene dehydrogenase-like protein